MPANAAIYLPIEHPDLAKVFPDAKSNAGLFRRHPTSYSAVLNGDQVTFNLLPHNEIAGHLNGILRYIGSLHEDEKRKADAMMALRTSKCVLGLETTGEFSENHAIWQALFKIADAFDGYVFVHESLLLPSGGVIIGALRHDT